MSNEERYKKYVKEHCIRCKNKDKDLCEIRVSAINNIVKTKCINYEREEKPKKKTPESWQRW